MPLIYFALTIALSLLFSSISVGQEASYTFKTINFPGASATAPAGINARGQIVGFYDHSGGVSGFLLDDGDFTPIDVPDSVDTRAIGINGHGDIVGEYSDRKGQMRGFVARKAQQSNPRGVALQ